jgi:ribosomal protein S18 acetylase RimI-like enzyme
MNDLHVREAARRRGVGRALVAAAAAQARARGGRYLLWTAQARNRRARAFYRRLGATEEQVIAYALSGEAFDQLAKAGASG